MGKNEKTDLLNFLQPFDNDITELVLWLRDFVWDLYPTTNELIYDNYNAVAFGWSPTDKLGHTFCSIAIGRTSKNVHFGFMTTHDIQPCRGWGLPFLFNHWFHQWLFLLKPSGL